MFVNLSWSYRIIVSNAKALLHFKQLSKEVTQGVQSHKCQTSFSSVMFPVEFAATSIFDFFLQQTLDTNCPLSSKHSFPEMGSTDPNLYEVIGIGKDL